MVHLCDLAKNVFTLGRSDYQRQYEPILYGWTEGAKHFWCGARDQGDVWFFDKPHRNDVHPTMKPVALMEQALANSSRIGDVVLDPFRRLRFDADRLREPEAAGACGGDRTSLRRCDSATLAKLHGPECIALARRSAV